MHSAKKIPTSYDNLPREVLSSLTSFRAGHRDRLLVANGHTYEGLQNPTFSKFLDAFGTNVHCTSVRLVGDEEEEFKRVTKVAKGKGREVSWDYWQPIEWEVKTGAEMPFQHHKLYFAIATEDKTVQWLMLGTHNFSAPGFGRHWPYEKSSDGRMLKKNECSNAEISVFIKGDVLKDPAYLGLDFCGSSRGGGERGLGMRLLSSVKASEKVAAAKRVHGEVARKLAHEHLPQYRNYSEDEDDGDEDEDEDEVEDEEKETRAQPASQQAARKTGVKRDGQLDEYDALQMQCVLAESLQSVAATAQRDEDQENYDLENAIRASLEHSR